MVCGEEDYARKVWLEHLSAMKGVGIIVEGARTSPGTTIIRTVPTGKVFYLTSCSLSAIQYDAGNVSRAWIQVTINGNTYRFCTMTLGRTGASVEYARGDQSQCFPTPLIFSAGDVFEVVYSGQLGIAYATIQGHDVDA